MRRHFTGDESYRGSDIIFILGNDGQLHLQCGRQSSKGVSIPISGFNGSGGLSRMSRTLYFHGVDLLGSTSTFGLGLVRHGIFTGYGLHRGSRLVDDVGPIGIIYQVNFDGTGLLY